MEIAVPVTLSDGSTLQADLVVLATGNFAPAPLSGTLLESIAILKLGKQAVGMAALLADRVRSDSSGGSLLIATSPHLKTSEQAA